VDEVFIRIRGVLYYLWRAVDQHGVVHDILVWERRNGATAERFFTRLLQGLRGASRQIVAAGSTGSSRLLQRDHPRHHTLQAINTR
jgi:putative transposase